MAQYYNLVTGTSVPIMVEDVQQICDGQSIRLVVEDLNNCTNGGQQFLTYTAAPQHHESNLYPQQTIVGSQLTGVPIDQRQNVYIINATNDLPVQQSGLKADVVHASLSNDGVVSIVDERGNQYVIAGTKLPNNIHEAQQHQQQQIQWINMPENNLNYEGTLKPGAPAVKLASTVRSPQQRTGPSAQEQLSAAPTSPYVGPGPSEKKSTPRSYRNKGRGCVTGGGPTRQSLLSVDPGAMIKGGGAAQQRGKNSPKAQQLGQLLQTLPSTDSPSMEHAPQNANAMNHRTTTTTTTTTTTGGIGNSLGTPYRGKSYGPALPNATVQSANSRSAPTRAAILSKTPDSMGQMRSATSTPPQGLKNPSGLHPAMDSLSERIKQAKLQKLATTAGQNLGPVTPTTPTPRPPLHCGPTRTPQTAQIQRPTTTTTPPMSATSPAILNQRGNSQSAQNEKSSLNCGQQAVASPGLSQQQQRRTTTTTKTPQQPLLQQDSRHAIEIIKKQAAISCQPKYQRDTVQTTATSPTATASLSENDERMEIDSITSECNVESDGTNSHEQQESTNEDNDGSSASFAYLQKVIESPQNTIVQKQISGNTAKMLVVLQNGEQRLITFDIPNEPCTVQDLLEQANISFGDETCVSLVSDRILGINYIVEGGAHMAPNCHDGNVESGEGGQFQENASPDSSSTNFSMADENSNSSVTPNEEPKFLDGKLAVCPNCGISSPDFHRCSRCKRILPDNVKAIPMTSDTQTKKEMMISVDTFYKKAHEQNASSKHEASPKLDSVKGKKPAARGGRRPAAKSRPIKEPECLTISSDEEDGGENSRKSDANMSNALSSTGCGMNVSDDLDTILDKEPVITSNTTSPLTDRMLDSERGIKGGGIEDESDDDDPLQKVQTSLICRTVRIGSYKYIPREGIIISQSGVRLAVPLLEDDQNFVHLVVRFREIIKVLIHFGKTMPVLFFYTSTSAAATIREVLGMQDPKGPYYDPAGRDHTHKRITLLPELLTAEAKVILKNLFIPDDLLMELTPKEANDILVRASPKDVQQNVQSSLGSVVKKPSQSTNPTNPGVNGTGVQDYQIMTVYPPPPAKGGIAINTEDYVCLGEDQFLNDAIIDFYLRYLTLEVLSETDHNRTHVFSSYFYKRLTSPHAQAGESSPSLTAAARRHARVQKWTKNVNIFEKDFIIIPINEHAHWFLAIICYPGLVGKVIAAPQPPKEKSAQKSAQKSKKSKEMKLHALTIGSTTITPVTTTITIDQLDEGSERDEAEGDEDEMEMDSDDDEETENQEENSAKSPHSSSNQVNPEVNQKPIVKIPCILIFDSLAGASRSRVVATLRDYLSCEHVAKMGTERVFSKDTIKGSSPKVPQQSNFTDCGLYLLQYVESFFQNPIRSYVLPIKTLKQWFEEIVVTRKREELAKLLVRLMNQTKGDKTITLPVVQFPTHDGKLRPKPETTPEMKVSKTETDTKKKVTQTGANAPQSPMNVDDKTRLVAVSTSSVLTTAESAGEKPELVTRTTTVYQIIPCASSPLSSASGDSSQETLFDSKPKAPSGTLSYLRNKRIPRHTRDQDSQENQPTSAKKHKGDNESVSRSSSGISSVVNSPIAGSPKAVIATNNDSCK